MNAVMINSLPRIASLVIGYFFGCLLTGEFVVRLKTGKSASEFGTGNPGMANVMRIFGRPTGLVVLAGDLLKTVLACVLCLFLFGGKHLADPHLAIGQISCLWAGLGAVLGHNWPFWRGFSGGKGVAVTCMAIFLFSPPWGLLSDLAGMLVVLTTGYLLLGAVVIPTLFTVFCFLFCPKEAALLALILTVIMFSRHIRGLIRMIRGKEEKNAQYLKRKKRPDPNDSGQNEQKSRQD
jgi:glycerol-3-phosphate acyltransferase PlsY